MNIYSIGGMHKDSLSKWKVSVRQEGCDRPFRNIVLLLAFSYVFQVDILAGFSYNSRAPP